MPTLKVAPQDARPPESHEPFVHGDALVSAVPHVLSGDPETYRELVEPVLNDLLAEIDSPTASGRMIAELAAQAFVDAALLTATARRNAGRDEDPGALRASATFWKMAERRSQVALECLALLRRPDNRSVRVSVGPAAALGSAPERSRARSSRRAG